ncbi:MAG: rhomboid family intramembrane serine protease [Planctomycetota bacterium]|jgi:membrane associated rhomboid family serine protease
MLVKIGFRRSISDHKWPSGNYIVMMLATVTFAIQVIGDPKQQYLNGFILNNLTLSSMFGYMWLHMSMPHILGNLITLWIFGRRVSLKISDASYVLSFFLLGIAASAVHVYYDGRPTIGASGAIMGVLGMHVVLCFRQFGVLGPWLILCWFLLNLTAGIIGSYPTTYMAHAGGFLAGMFLATLLLIFKVAEWDDTGLSLLRIMRPSLYKAVIDEKSSLSGETVSIMKSRLEMTNSVSFRIDTVQSGK